MDIRMDDSLQPQREAIPIARSGKIGELEKKISDLTSSISLTKNEIAKSNKIKCKIKLKDVVQDSEKLIKKKAESEIGKDKKGALNKKLIEQETQAKELSSQLLQQLKSNIAKEDVSFLYDPNTVDENNNSAIMMAVRSGSIDTVKALLDREGIDLNAKNNKGETVLDIAIQEVRKEGKSEEIACLLLEKGAKFSYNEENLKFFISICPVIQNDAVREVALNSIDEILQNRPDLKDTQDERGNTALLIAAYPTPDSKFIEKFITHGVNISLENFDRNTVIDLVLNNANIKPEDKAQSIKAILTNPEIHGKTALDFAIEMKGEKSREIVTLLIENGANFSHNKESLSFCINMCFTTKDKKFKEQLLKNIEEILKSRPDLKNSQDEHGNTVLLAASYPPQNQYFIQTFLNLGVNPNLENNDNHTSWSYLISYGDFNDHETCSTAKLFVEKGIDINKSDMSGDTLFHAVCREENPNTDFMEYILKHKNFNSSVKNRNEETALDALLNATRVDLDVLEDKSNLNKNMKTKIRIIAGLFKMNMPFSVEKNFETCTDLIRLTNDDGRRAQLLEGVLKSLATSKQLTSREINSMIDVIKDLSEEYADLISYLEPGLLTSVLCNVVRSDLDYEVIEKLLNLGADLYEINDDGTSAISLMIANNHHNLSSVLNRLNIDLSRAIPDKSGATLLHHAIINNNIEVTNYLLSNGMNASDCINAKDRSGNTALHYACDAGLLDMIEVLTTNGADKNTVDSNQNSPLLRALMFGQEKCAKFLIGEGYDVNMSNNEGRTPLHIASEQGLLDIVKAILNKSTDTLDSKNKYNNTPLFRALAFGHEECANYLIQKNADLTLTNEDGMTPMHIACEKGLINVVNTLISSNVDLNSVDSDNRTPLSIALDKGELLCAKRLLQQGALLDKTDEDRFGNALKLLQKGELEEPLTMEEFTDRAVSVFKNSFKNVFHHISGLDQPESNKNFEMLFTKFSDKADTLVNKVDIAGTIEERKTKLLSDLREVYLESLFEIHKNEMEQLQSAMEMDVPSKRGYFSTINPVLDVIRTSYINRQKGVLEQQGNSLVLLEHLLTEDLNKVVEELDIMFAMLDRAVAGPMEYVPSELKRFREDDLYLLSGICFGASLTLAAKRANAKKESDIELSGESRFIQAAHSIRNRKNFAKNILWSNNKQEFGVDESFQKKLNINIGSTEKLSYSSVVDFVQNIDSLLPKLNVEKSPNFLVRLNTPGAAYGHAIYCHLSPPYEIQDVDYPGYSIKTEDLQQFKVYLLLYFRFMSPGNYKNVRDIYQITKR